MAYDEGLAQRIREQLGDRPGITEKKMFGGLAFLMRGNMCVGVSQDSMIVRGDAARYEQALTRPGVRVFESGGRVMKAWLLVDQTALEDDDTLAAWIDFAFDHVRSLPAKTSSAAKAPAKRPVKPRTRKPRES